MAKINFEKAVAMGQCPIGHNHKKGGLTNMNKSDFKRYIASLTDEEVKILFDHLPELIEQMEAAGISLMKDKQTAEE